MSCQPTSDRRCGKGRSVLRASLVALAISMLGACTYLVLTALDLSGLVAGTAGTVIVDELRVLLPDVALREFALDE